MSAPPIDRVRVEPDRDGGWIWRRVSRNGTVIARSHRSWPTPGRAHDNAATVNRAPYTLVSPQRITRVDQ